MTYIVGFRRNDRLGLEEYDGGHTIADARKEAQFFCDNLPTEISVKIFTVDGGGRLHLKEVVR